MLTEQQFRDELRIFVEKMNENNINWKLQENGQTARESHLVELPDGEFVTQDSHIIYNSTYQTPTLWFNFHAKSWFFSVHFDVRVFCGLGILNYDSFSGAPIDIETVERDLLKIPKTESTASIRTRISQYEHPFLGVLYYNIHPCQTSQLMKELKLGEGTWLMSWLSVYGQQIGLRIPDIQNL
ncbi:hypothetical protein CAEBREN_25303 [Caenorhabditis brenneri]|uniref:Ubiquitin-like-conjugating enzyme ATG10 n=1 Tax=Caenorhabditis brenneri TaxID=135651 RepID=G0N3L3_CAEBE|nr:hypothetical protein CAEBREN_25303 [Caenorhabditis brenneri]